MPDSGSFPEQFLLKSLKTPDSDSIVATRKRKLEAVLTAKMAKNIIAVLEENLVSCDRVKQDTKTYSKYELYTDHSKVFVKLMRDRDLSLARFKAAVDFGVESGYGVNPLLESIYHEDANQRELLMSAWEYRNTQVIGSNIDVIAVGVAATELHKVHSSPKYYELLKNTDEVRAEYREGFQSPSFHVLTGKEQAVLRDAYTNIIVPALDLVTLREDLNVPVHGAPYLRKLLRDEYGEIYWSDFETVRSAPREYDLAVIWLEFSQVLKRPDLWDIFLNHYEEAHGSPINQNTLNQFVEYHFVHRAFYLATHQMYVTEERLSGIVNEVSKLQASEPMTHWKKIGFYS